MKTKTYLVSKCDINTVNELMSAKGIVPVIKNETGNNVPSVMIEKLNLLSEAIGMGSFDDTVTYDVEITCIEPVHRQLEQHFCIIL
jgi:hypothetical protein